MSGGSDDKVVSIESSGVRLERVGEEFRVRIRLERAGRVRATLQIEPYRVPEGGAEVVPIRSEKEDE